MRNIFRSKSGVSPLIATVLLIAFAVALGALVMTWGRQYIEETQEQVEQRSFQSQTCLDVGIVSRNIAEKPCYDTDDKQIYIVLDNDRVELSGLKTIVYGPDINTTDYDEPISIGESVLLKIGYGSPDIEQVRIIPMISSPGSKEDTPCTGRAIEIDYVNAIDYCAY